MSALVSLSEPPQAILNFVGAGDAHVSVQRKFFRQLVLISGRLERSPADLVLTMYWEGCWGYPKVTCLSLGIDRWDSFF